jgi:hypothetical protein
MIPSRSNVKSYQFEKKNTLHTSSFRRMKQIKKISQILRVQAIHNSLGSNCFDATIDYEVGDLNKAKNISFNKRSLRSEINITRKEGKRSAWVEEVNKRTHFLEERFRLLFVD